MLSIGLGRTAFVANARFAANQWLAQLFSADWHIIALTGARRAVRERQTWHKVAGIPHAMLQQHRVTCTRPRGDTNVPQQAEPVRISKCPQ
jgi:hypothetical protein